MHDKWMGQKSPSAEICCELLTRVPPASDDRKEPEDFVRKMNELVTDDHTIKDIAAATSDTTFERAAKEQVKLYR